MKFLKCTLLIILTYTVSIAQTTLTSAALGKLEARNIGPAVMGGRITSIQGVASDPKVLYVGTGGGGIWKTVDGGSRFFPVFDKHPQSIGCLAIDSKNSDIIWAGTGECNMRNSVSVGKGIYQSIDGGENWTSMGLENTERISKIILHPTQKNVLFVAVPGPLWNDSPERGLFKSADGGKTWEKILYVNEKTGCADIVMDPRNPNVLIASMWEFRRKPFSFVSGGPGSGLFKSTDGGKTWSPIRKGLPEGNLGRIALAMSPSAPDNLVAIVESEKTGLFISSDLGESWNAQSSDENVSARPFYFATVEFDPKDSKRVYRPAFEFSFSDDGGHSWNRSQNSSGWVHVDMHALWINPDNNSHMYVGTDGGMYMSVDRGNNWIQLNNMPIGQFYHVQIDQKTPYHVYGGLQDNGSWTAPSRDESGIENGDWKNVGGGDGFWVQPLPSDPSIIFSEYQGGHISRIDRKTNHYRDVQPQALAGEEKLRFNWNTPIYFSPTQKDVLYTASQYLYRSKTQGESWEKISNDLTTNNPEKKKQEQSGGVTVDNTSAENHCTIFTIAESPIDPQMIWVGTDDGNLQLSKDGGKSWTNLSQNYAISGIPPQTWISSIEPSRFDKNTVYVSFDNHMYGDMKTYLAVSKDAGNTWTRLNAPVLKGFAHKIKEDLVNKELLFAGTEWGMYFSSNSGKDWVVMKAGIPEYLAIRDIQIDPKTNDLILGTHGRSILIIDDISPLRQLNSVTEKDIAYVASRPVPVTVGHLGGSWPNAGGFVGANPSEEAVILYYLKERAQTGSVDIEIVDPNGKTVVNLPGTKRKGLNKIYWNMRYAPPKVAEGGAKADWSSTYGPLAVPGTYTVRIKSNNLQTTGNLELINDPVSSFTLNDRKESSEAQWKVFSLHENLGRLMDTVLQFYQPLKELSQKGTLTPQQKSFLDSLEVVRGSMVAVKEGTALTGEEKIREKLSELYYGILFYEGKPTESQKDKMQALSKEIEDVRNKFAEVKLMFPKQLQLKKQNSPK